MVVLYVSALALMMALVVVELVLFLFLVLVAIQRRPSVSAQWRLSRMKERFHQHLLRLTRPRVWWFERILVTAVSAYWLLLVIESIASLLLASMTLSVVIGVIVLIGMSKLVADSSSAYVDFYEQGIVRSHSLTGPFAILFLDDRTQCLDWGDVEDFSWESAGVLRLRWASASTRLRINGAMQSRADQILRERTRVRPAESR